jgi:hypothetical protein
MKLTKAQLRKIVRTNLLETPLMDIIPFKNKRIRNEFTSSTPSIGYKLPSVMKGTEQEKRNQFTDAAKILLADSEDNWYIVVLKNVGYYKYDPSNIIKSPEFLQWMSSLNIPKGSKILIPGQSNLKGDYRTPEWQIVHDIIGHTIYKYYRKEIKTNFEIEGHEEIFNLFEDAYEEHKNITWQSLPDEFKISKRNPDDRLPDILAAVFANKFDRQKAVEMYEKLNIFNMTNVNNSLDALYKIVESWKKSIPYDTPTVVYPF